MSRRPWYKRYPSDFIASTLHLNLEQKGAFNVVLDLIYDRGGPIPDEPQTIARICGCSTRKWKKLRAELIELGKLEVVDNSFLMNARAGRESENGEKEREKLAESGAKGGLKTQKNQSENNDNNDLTPFEQQAGQRPDTRLPIKDSIKKVSNPSQRPWTAAEKKQAWEWKCMQALHARYPPEKANKIIEDYNSDDPLRKAAGKQEYEKVSATFKRTA